MREWERERQSKNQKLNNGITFDILDVKKKNYNHKMFYDEPSKSSYNFFYV